jgi:hypothetical protein
MASSDIDLVRSIYAAWDRGDFREVDWADPKIEFVMFPPIAGVSVGLPRMAERWRDFLTSWKGFRTEVDEYRELDDERVLVLHLDHLGMTACGP